ncbi:hypothetical protein PQQ63_06050 [Paraburkholderia metrosideri]|uniref:Uncharacterized protein n=1 Tax=Paraburkholderia metrosideri TaxID=580937 RepID=A0ABW9DN49_9BURK
MFRTLLLHANAKSTAAALRERLQVAEPAIRRRDVNAVRTMIAHLCTEFYVNPLTEEGGEIACWRYTDMSDFTFSLGTDEFVLSGDGPYLGLVASKAVARGDGNPFLLALNEGGRNDGERYTALARKVTIELSRFNGCEIWRVRNQECQWRRSDR